MTFVRRIKLLKFARFLILFIFCFFRTKKAAKVVMIVQLILPYLSDLYSYK